MQFDGSNPIFLQFHQNPPTLSATIRSLEMKLGRDLPADYKEFMLSADGGEGFVGNAYIILWKTEEFWDFNKNYEVFEFAPELLFFGSNGAGEGLAFDTRKRPWRVVVVPFIGMELSAALGVSPSFDAFVQRLAEGGDLL